MPFSDAIKSIVKKKADFSCCICHKKYVEVHHIKPQAEGGQDTEDNAAPLCPSCHELYGANPTKRKFIRETRDHWYEICAKGYSENLFQYKELLKDFVTKEQLDIAKGQIVDSIKSFVDELLPNIKTESERNVTTVLSIAKNLINKKEYISARALLEEFSKQNPENSEFYYVLGYVCGEVNDFDKMNEYFDRSKSLAKNIDLNITQFLKYHWAIQFNKGVKFFQDGNSSDDQEKINAFYNNSIEAFQTAAMIDPDSTETYKNLAFVYMNAGKFDEAIEPLQKIISMENSRDGYKFLGQIYYDKARKLKMQFEVSNDNHDRIKYLEYYDKTINVLEQGRHMYPDDSDILVTLSNAYIGANKTEVAMEAFKAGIELDPQNKYYHYNYGVLLLGTKDFPNAANQFEKAIEIDANYTNAQYNLGVTYLKWSDYINQQANSLGMKNPDYKQKSELAKTYFEQSIPFLEKAIELDATQPDIWETLGKAYTVVDKQSEAKNAFDKSDQLRKQ